MKLRYIVPALGLVAVSTTAQAENIGGLTIGGFVDVVTSVEHTKNADFTDAGASATYGTGAAIELRLGYKVGENITTQIDLEWNNAGTDDRSVYLEQAYVNWALNDTSSLTAGKYTTYAGWVAADADGLYRINDTTLPLNIYGGELLGVAYNMQANADIGISFFLVNGLDVIENNHDNGNATGNIALAVDAVYNVADLGSFNLEAGYDYINDDSNEISVGLNTTLNLASVKALTIGGELYYRTISDYEALYLGDLAPLTGGPIDGRDSTVISFLALANYALEASFPMSVTGQITYANLKYEGGVDATVKATEFAVALLTNPTNDANFGVNAEVFYNTIDADRAENANSTGIALEFLALIP